jgi:hypothetical protein
MNSKYNTIINFWVYSCIFLKGTKNTIKPACINHCLIVYLNIMVKMRKICYVLIIILSFNYLYAQSYKINGRILDSKKKEALFSAIITYFQNDNKKNGVFSDKAGYFEINSLNPGPYTLNFSYIGYKNLEKKIQIRNADIALGNIYLVSDSIVLKEVTSFGKLPIAEQKNDTIQYIANSYKINKDANAQDLIEKMPGILLDNGTVKAQGETIKQVFVDGRQFFGDDPNAVLLNLPAEIIEKVQVYDKLSEQAQFTGFTDEQPVKVMNIITRANTKDSKFGKILGGLGDEAKYQATGILSIFDDLQRISLFAQSNNINEQNFSIADIMGALNGGLQSGGGRSNRRGSRSMRQGSIGRSGQGRTNNNRNGTSDFLVNQQDGVSKINAFGVNYTNYFGSKTQFTGSYFFNYSNNDANKDVKRNYFPTGGIAQDYFENSNTGSKNINHRFNFRLEYQPDSMTRLLVIPKMTFQSNNGSSDLNASNYFNDTLSSNTINNLITDLKASNLSNEIVFNKKLNSEGRSISIDFTTAMNNNSGNNTHSAENFYFDDPESLDSLLQSSTLDKNTYRISTNLLYTEPLGNNYFLQMGYNISDNINKSEKRTFDTYKQGIQVDSLSNIFESDYWIHRPNITFGYQTKEIRFSLGLTYNLSNLKNLQDFPYSSDINRKFTVFLPVANFRYNIARQQNFQFTYIPQVNIPSISQLQNVLNNSNQLQLSIGNPALDQEVDHNINIRYSSVSDDFTDTYFFMVSTRIAGSYLGRSTFQAAKDTMVLNNIFLNKGTQITYPVNLNGYWNLNGFSNFGTSVPSIHSSLNFHAMLSYSKVPTILNNLTYFSLSKSASLGSTLSSNMSENFDFTFTTNYSYNDISSSNNTVGNSDYYNLYFRLRLSYTFWDNFIFMTNGNYQYYSSAQNNYNPNNLLVNISLSKKFLHNNQAEIKITAFDIFNKNNGLQKNSNELYIEDVTTNVLKRYFLLTFTYNLRYFSSNFD